MTIADFRSLQATFVPRPDQPGQGRLFFWCMPPRRVDYARKALGALGIMRRGKNPPTGRLELVIPTPTRNRHEDWEIAELNAIRLPLVEAVRGLARLDLSEGAACRISDSVRAWALAAKLAVEGIAQGQFVPLLDRTPREQVIARWASTTPSPQTRERLQRIEDAIPIAGHCLVLDEGSSSERRGRRRKNRRRRRRKPVTEHTTVWEPGVLLRAFMDAVADAVCRDASPSSARDKPRKDNRELAAWELRWRYALTAADPTFESAGLVERRLPDEIARWASPVRPKVMAGTPYAVTYQLELPGSSPETREVPDTWFLRYRLQANDDPNVLVDADRIWASDDACIEVGERMFLNPHEVLLESLAETARLFAPVARSLHTAMPAGTLLTTEEAWDFIAEVGPVLQQFGVGVRVPRELRADGRQRLRLKLRVGTSDEGTTGGDGAPSRVGLSALAGFRWQVALGAHDLTPEEFREVAAMKQPLVQWRGQWLAVDPRDLAEMERVFDEATTAGTMDRGAALAAALAGTFEGDARFGEIEVVAEGDIAALIANLRDADQQTPVPTPDRFQGTLRPYQERGLTWLAALTDLGFGVCLADDMGLGKTIQVIALLLANHERQRWGDTPALLVCPTSVLGNWERELRRFAPDLRIVRHHGRTRASSLTELRQPDGQPTVVLTTYVLARLDAELLGRVRWSHLIIDEAQNIKNPASQQARALRSLPAERRLALTGTPVENRLTELWSILEFANPGFLGGLGDFRRRFAVPIERLGDQAAAERLRRLAGTFILRRVKTDPTVIQDLPEKQEQKIWCTLTREQATLYQAAVDNTLDRISESSGMKRKANILALLTALKQICNHPAHYLKEGGDRLPARSGKLTRLSEMMEELAAEGDRALIFSQYKEMGDLLHAHFKRTLGVDLPFIHGGVPPLQRDHIVQTFQEDEDAAPALLLSLKAGGTGLNLTRATHVFHFDRWWNPAVEDQATDRAFRVGQTRHVRVHKFIVAGTIEEKIDGILESKRDLADSIVGDGETWLTELDDDALRDLFALDRHTELDDDVEPEP